MPINLADLLKNPRLLTELRTNSLECCRCGIALQETLTGKRKVQGGHACSDCYYGDFDEELDQHPIGSAGFRRS